MIMGISSLVFVPLLAIAIVHFLWALGFNYPVKDQKTLARTVAGFKDIEKMPPRLMSALVGIGVLSAGIWILAMADPAPNLTLTFGGIILAIIFLGRGLIGFTKKWAEITPEEPFRTFDRKFYSPLSIGIGLGTLILVLWRIF